MAGTTSKRYTAELPERAVRMVGKVRGDHGSEWAAMTKVAAPVTKAIESKWTSAG